MTERLFPDVDVTEVRKTLIAESHECYRLATSYYDTIKTPAVTTFEFDVYVAICAANSYSYLLAGVLRIIEDRHGPDEAREMAALFDAVREAGTEVLEDTNSDLDEQARADGPTAADIDAALDAKAEDGRIEAERVR